MNRKDRETARKIATALLGMRPTQGDYGPKGGPDWFRGYKTAMRFWVRTVLTMAVVMTRRTANFNASWFYKLVGLESALRVINSK